MIQPIASIMPVATLLPVSTAGDGGAFAQQFETLLDASLPGGQALAAPGKPLPGALTLVAAPVETPAATRPADAMVVPAMPADAVPVALIAVAKAVTAVPNPDDPATKTPPLSPPTASPATKAQMPATTARATCRPPRAGLEDEAGDTTAEADDADLPPADTLPTDTPPANTPPAEPIRTILAPQRSVAMPVQASASAVAIATAIAARPSPASPAGNMPLAKSARLAGGVPTIAPSPAESAGVAVPEPSMPEPGGVRETVAAIVSPSPLPPAATMTRAMSPAQGAATPVATPTLPEVPTGVPQATGPARNTTSPGPAGSEVGVRRTQRPAAAVPARADIRAGERDPASSGREPTALPLADPAVPPPPERTPASATTIDAAATPIVQTHVPTTMPVMVGATTPVPASTPGATPGPTTSIERSAESDTWPPPRIVAPAATRPAASPSPLVLGRNTPDTSVAGESPVTPPVPVASDRAPGPDLWVMPPMRRHVAGTASVAETLPAARPSRPVAPAPAPAPAPASASAWSPTVVPDDVAPPTIVASPAVATGAVISASVQTVTPGADPAIPVVQPQAEASADLLSPADPAPARLPASPAVTRLAPPPTETQPIAAGTTAPAFRLFAAAIHAVRSEENEQRALPAIGPATPTGPLVAPVAMAGAQGSPLDMTDHRWPQGMIDRIEHLRDTASAATDAASTSIRLVPDALGAIDVSLRREGDTVRVHFNAEQAATRALIADAQPRLAELAEARGIRLTQGEVAAPPQGQASGQQSQTAAGQTGGQTPGGQNAAQNSGQNAGQNPGQNAGQHPAPGRRPAAPLSRAPEPTRDDDSDTTTTRIG